MSKTTESGKIVGVELAIDYAPTELMPLPRLADFRIGASKPVWLRDAEPGPALVAADKDLQAFPPWNDPFQRRTDGSFQILAHDTAGTDRIKSGRLATLTFALEEWGPVEFSLIQREQTLAPPDSDAAIQSTGYDGIVVVTRH